MTKFIDLQEAFEIELNVLDDGLNKPKSMDTEWWLNRGLEKFWKTRYSGMNVKRTSFEEDQKRTDDLRTLIATVEFDKDSIQEINKSFYTVSLPDDYVILLGDKAGIQPFKDDCWETDENGEYITKYDDTIEATVENIDKQLKNSLSEHKLRYSTARPLKLVQGNLVKLFTDGNYKVTNYSLTYLRKPEYIDIHSNPFEEYTDMPEHTHSEIVKIAAQMYMENKSDKRVNTHNVEVQEME